MYPIAEKKYSLLKAAAYEGSVEERLRALVALLGQVVVG
jgi:hypothetical protein